MIRSKCLISSQFPHCPRWSSKCDRLTPVRVVFPQHKPDEWAKENRRTASRDVSVEKHVSQDLNTLAPEVEEFIARLSMSMDTVEELMRDQTDTQDSYFDVACRWLRSNEAKWSDWLPEKGKCFSQFGMYDDACFISRF